MFGDQYTHQQNSEQIRSYFNRFGPGLIIYWFGFVEEIKATLPSGVIVMDRFPDASSVVTLEHENINDTPTVEDTQELE